MAKNNKHWTSMMASSADRAAASEGIDPLEEGLEALSWFENSKRIVKKSWNKTRETFGEEVGNSITSGIIALYVLFMIPFGSVYAFTHVYEGVEGIVPVVDSFAVSAFLMTAFLASLFTTIYHCMKHGTPQKRVFGKLDHIFVYFAIAGVFAPICLSIVGGTLGTVILSVELGLAVLGMFFMIFGYPNNKGLSKAAVAIYGIMGLVGIALIKPLYLSATPVCFWLIMAGVITYVVGIFFYSGKKFKFSHMVWHILVVFATVCHVLAFVYFLH